VQGVLRGASAGQGADVAFHTIGDQDIVVVASSGTSGAGRAAKTSLLGAEVMGDLHAYKVGNHQHVHEMNQALGIPALSFTPVLSPLPRGMLATSTATVRAGVEAADLRSALVAAYADEPFVVVSGRSPSTKATFGANTAHLTARRDPRTGLVYQFHSVDLWVEPSAWLPRGGIPVRIDPANPKRYEMDLGFVPAEIHEG